MVGTRGKRTPGRPGRFDPTEPLHMKTRKSAKGSTGTDGSHDDESPEQAGHRHTSNGSTSSRRSSIYGPEPPAKRQRTAEASPNATTEPPSNTQYLPSTSAHLSLSFPNTSNGADQEDGSEDLGPERNYYHRFGLSGPPVNKADVPIAPSELRMIATEQATTQKTTTPISDSFATTSVQEEPMHDVPNVVEGADADVPKETLNDEIEPFAAFATDNAGQQKDAEKEVLWTEEPPVSVSEELMESKVNSSASSPANSNVVENVNVQAASTDVTPMVTRQGTPATPASGALGETPARLGTLVLDLGESTDEDTNDMEAIAPTQETVEDAADPAVVYEEEEGEEGTVRKTNKRRYAGGRRRATHANIVVEAAMRRQLELKQIYRQVTRGMKACLGELSQLTLDELDTNSEAHTEAAEYDEVMAELNDRLAQRKEQLYAAQRFNQEQLKQRWHAERDVRMDQCENQIGDLKDKHIVNLEYNMLRVHRDRLAAATVTEQETEDEDGIIPRPKAMGYRYKRAEEIDLRYDSRSRLQLETERKVKDLEHRTKMWDVLKAYAPNEIAGFTVMGSEVREAAKERQNSIAVTKKLAAIAAEYEELFAPKPPPPPPPALSADDLAPLNFLAELAGRPALQPKQFPVTQHLPPRESPMSAVSSLEKSQDMGYARQSSRQPLPPPTTSMPESLQAMGYPQQSPRQPSRQSPMPMSEVRQGYVQQSPRLPAMSLSGVSNGMGYPGVGVSQQSPRQSTFAPMRGYFGSQRLESDVASQPPPMPRPMFPEQTMGPPPTPLQTTASTTRSPVLRHHELPPASASMGFARGVDGMPPLAAKPSEIPNQQHNQPHSRRPSLPPLLGVHPDRINIIAEANKMSGSSTPTLGAESPRMQPSGPPPGSGPPPSHTQANTGMRPPSPYALPYPGMQPSGLPPPYTQPYTPQPPMYHSMYQSNHAPGPQQTRPDLHQYHIPQPQPYQWQHASPQDQAHHEGHAQDRAPRYGPKRSKLERLEDPAPLPWVQPHYNNMRHGHDLPPRPPPTEAPPPPTLPRLPARPFSSGNGMANAPRSARPTHKPNVDSRHGISRKKWKTETEEVKDRLRAQSISHHLARQPSPAPEPGRRSSALDGLRQPPAFGNALPRPSFPPPMPYGDFGPQAPYGSIQQRWDGAPPPRPTAMPVDHFGGGAPPRRELTREEQEREDEAAAAWKARWTYNPGFSFD